MLNVEEVASQLRSDIQYYVDLTVEEHQTQKLNKEADKIWKKIERQINLLVREAI